MLGARRLAGIKQVQKECQVSLGVAGNQEVLADVLVGLLTEPLRNGWVRKQETNLVGGAFDGMDEQPRVLVDDLEGDAADRRSHHRLLLPHSFSDGQPEALAQALLDDNG